MGEGVTKHREIIHEYFHGFLDHVLKYGSHTSLKCSKCITQAERHPPISKCTKGAGKSCLLLVLRRYWYLEISLKTIKKIVKHMSSQAFNHLINK